MGIAWDIHQVDVNDWVCPNIVFSFYHSFSSWLFMRQNDDPPTPLTPLDLGVPSGELTFCHGKSPFFMGKSTISMAIFHCFLYVHQRVPHVPPLLICIAEVPFHDKNGNLFLALMVQPSSTQSAGH